MKKLILLIISSIISLGLITGCGAVKDTKTIVNKEKPSTAVKEEDIREVAYNQLTSNEKARIAGTWKDSKLYKITLKEGMGIITEKSYLGKEVYLVDFPTKDLGVQSNMIVYLSIDNKKLLGYGYID